MTKQLNLPLLRKGKVREVYDLQDKLLIVASDRVSTFDHILPTQIPGKGKILSKISNFWFKTTKGIVQNHLISDNIDEINKVLPADVQLDKEYYGGRTVLVKKAQRIDFECVVRGYIAGSAWEEYKKQGTVCGQKMPQGLLNAQKLESPIFTPAAKNDEGHDENVPFSYMEEKLGAKLAAEIKEKSIALYNFGEQYLKERGIILADTKFEFGLINGELILIDEVLTPDSSRFWDAAHYKPGSNPASFDKQFIRDYMEQTGWDKNSVPPAMSQEIVNGAVAKYNEALERITKGSL
ncbi:MAG: phosphoribosylaminoimidazolesuccinocarboxamide synthase [Elusimicrobiota bacterium]|jgi:phosphoribosylaminoimidazole-succinocarboxamide synthase|nr:phosphoribosylaminoimidazolesuccinocarboxamide synthase [Elusimicrobiota bacterium]